MAWRQALRGAALLVELIGILVDVLLTSALIMMTAVDGPGEGLKFASGHEVAYSL